jgi:hypothetical protein
MGNERLDDSLTWRKSTASDPAQCVEVAKAGGTVLVRDSKNPQGPKLALTNGEWEAFLRGVRKGQFDMDNLPG